MSSELRLHCITVQCLFSSSLIERILREAWKADIKYRAVIAGNRVNGAAREMLRRLSACGLPCTYVDITAISYVMKTVSISNVEFDNNWLIRQILGPSRDDTIRSFQCADIFEDRINRHLLGKFAPSSILF